MVVLFTSNVPKLIKTTLHYSQISPTNKQMHAYRM